MKLIKYFNKIREFKEIEKENELGIKETVLEETSRIEPLEYQTSNREFEYWLDVIKKSYGMHGDVTWINIEEIKEPTELDILKKQINSMNKAGLYMALKMVDKEIGGNVNG